VERQRPGESDKDYLARLQESLREMQQGLHHTSAANQLAAEIKAVRQRLQKPARALEKAKRAVKNLTARELEQFLLWLSQWRDARS
jgi:hypothetical protein